MHSFYYHVVPALCEGDIIDGDGDNNVKADVNRVYDVCYPTSNPDEEEQNLSFKFDDFRGPSNIVTIIANYYTGVMRARARKITKTSQSCLTT